MEHEAVGMTPENKAFRDFAELSSDWFWEQDAEFRFARFFGVSTEKLHRKQSEFIGKRRWEMGIAGITADQLAEHIATCERHEPFHRFEYTVPGDGDALQYYSVSGMPVFDEQGVFVGYHGVARNITELRLAELAIKESVRQLSQIVDGSPIPIFVIDAEHRVTHWNQACEKLTGFNRRDMLGQTGAWKAFYSEARPLMADLVVSGSKEDDIAEQHSKFNRSALISEAVEAEGFFPNMGVGGRWLYFTAAPLRNSELKVTGAIETLQDITDQRKARAVLEQLASRDGLTGIANRRCFDEKINIEWKRKSRDSQCMSLLMLDIDHFKTYNDTYGHQGGDHCLQRIAKALEQLLFRPSDTVARYGGEEFAVILPGSDVEGAKVVARRILERVAELAIPHSGEKGGLVTLSIGIATSQSRTDTTLESLIASADKALYQAKESGRNQFVVDQPKDG
jgi:diguanylate cyclase (GGDEF)-like protein/PAS domain S-box-containing protein